MFELVIFGDGMVKGDDNFQSAGHGWLTWNGKVIGDEEVKKLRSLCVLDVL